MNIDNGYRAPLVIDGVFDGTAGVQGRFLSFVPNRGPRQPHQAVAGLLNGQPIRLTAQKDPEGPFWTAKWEPLA